MSQESLSGLKTLIMCPDNQVRVVNVPQDFQDHYLATIAKRNRQLTSVQIAKEFAIATGIRLSRFTVSDRLHKKKVVCNQKPMICIPQLQQN
ncbi:hypothetical protein CEXT_710541 [Caerostris extrusa]|uniref:Transposase n=1 Tax=Caerostris extrusa TaxID=172846 RepID=A0AAV4R7U4_CAEEX|nr:hypothetical protein CEXT_710541 [Caerostris extrusa]